ncbi:hypothetical protein GCM10027360_43180 [Amycolatopsis echigonensis]
MYSNAAYDETADNENRMIFRVFTRAPGTPSVPGGRNGVRGGLGGIVHDRRPYTTSSAGTRAGKRVLARANSEWISGVGELVQTSRGDLPVNGGRPGRELPQRDAPVARVSP